MDNSPVDCASDYNDNDIQDLIDDVPDDNDVAVDICGGSNSANASDAASYNGSANNGDVFKMSDDNDVTLDYSDYSADDVPRFRSRRQ